MYLTPLLLNGTIYKDNIVQHKDAILDRKHK
jgi:hypothetical protein